ncbi:TonB-dependent Receptor Plug Domain [Chitinophaga costaii]|uniref:TonB-dependent Receptor Plug Domain n=1 Tax=Chitinophaga costaii TaxID=1335309 RepID=A0A1C4F4M2_9BACT|nr:TonB-dependent receptor [Chitinophaga costaii]PUZ22081.1 TonB-dependent receptor [Chitinophaga costaii]SCC50613.1 TonB-dependent Receptor Plug Domain [Chitinophaga costaii]
MKLLLLLLIAGSLPVLLHAQTTVSGQITDAKKRPLAGANIAVQDSYDGATSSKDGHFSFTTTETGDKFLLITLNGYQPLQIKISLNGKAENVVLIMKQAANELRLVTISAGTFEASSKTNTVLKPLDIATTAGANADIVSALKTLPGAQQIGDKTGLFVRGGTGYETQTYIDGLLVRNPFFSEMPDLPSRGRFSPFLFKGTTFSSGGYSAAYGQALSSALILESNDLPDRSSSSVGISTVGVNLGLQELAKNKKSSYGVEADYTNLAPYFKLVPQDRSTTIYPAFWNGSANYRLKTSRTGMLKFYGYVSTNKLGFTRESLEYPGYLELFELHNRSVYTNLTWKEKLDDNWRVDLGVSYSTNTDKIKLDTISKRPPAAVNNRSDLSQFHMAFSRGLGNFSSLKLGAEYQYAVENSAYNQYHKNYIDNYGALFAESEISLAPRLLARVGARAEHSTVLDKTVLAPRASLGYKLDQYAQLSMAYGEYYEKPEPDFIRWDRQLNYMRATHYIATYQKLATNYTFRAEVFYKKYHHLMKTIPDTSNGGTGYARGAEIFWRDKKTFKNVDYWVSYSFLDTHRQYLDFPKSVQPNFAATHTLSVVYKQYIPKITSTIGVTYSFATGRPYYNPTLPVTEFMSQHTKPYNTIGFSANYLTTIRKAFTVFVFTVTNITGNNLVYNYNYSTDGQRRQEVTPNAPRFFFLGMFMSFGIDRRQEVIDNQ